MYNVRDFPIGQEDTKAQLAQTLVGMDDEVWRQLNAVVVSPESAYDAYEREALRDAPGAWAALCGAAILHIRAKRLAEMETAADGADSAFSEATASLAGWKNAHDGLPSGMPDAEELARQACRDEDLIRAQTVALYAAWRTENSHWLRETRERLLDGQLIPPQDMDRFLISPAIRILSVSDFRSSGVPVSRAFSELRASPQYEPHQDPIWKCELHIVDFGVVSLPSLVSETITSLRGTAPPDINAPFSSLEDAPFFPGSVFPEIFTAARYLDRCLLRCGLEPALRFLLSGQAPASFPVDAVWLASIANGGDPVLSGKPSAVSLESAPQWKATHVSLTFPLWLSADVAELAFRKVQRAILGAENRPFKEQNVRMLYFVLQERRRRGIAGRGTETERRQTWTSWNELCRSSQMSTRQRRQAEVEAPGMPDPLADMEAGWVVENFAYFNLTANRMEEKLFPSFF